MTAIGLIVHPYTRNLGVPDRGNLTPCAAPGCGFGPFHAVHAVHGVSAVSYSGAGRQVRRLHLERDADASGISGTGAVAYGAQFPDGQIVLRWDTKVSTTVHYACLADLLTIVGHGGATRVVFDDE